LEHSEPEIPPWACQSPNRIIVPPEIAGIRSHSHSNSRELWISTADINKFLRFQEGNGTRGFDESFIPEVFKDRLEPYDGGDRCISGCYSRKSVILLFVTRFPGFFAVENGCCNPSPTNPQVCSFDNIGRRILDLNTQIAPQLNGSIIELRFHEMQQGTCVLSNHLVFETFLKTIPDSGYLVIRDKHILVDYDANQTRKAGRPSSDKKYPGRTVAYRLTRRPTDPD